MTAARSVSPLTPTMKGIIYCRVSSLEQVNGTSLENQREVCSKYATDKSIEVTEVFVEKGESATAATRTELLRALDYCRKHKHQIAAFIVWKVDRFARNTTDHYGLQAELLKYGTRLYSATEAIINEGPLGKMAEAMLAGYAQFENDMRKQRCEGGMQRKIADGIWPWRPPIGYLHAKKLSDRRKNSADEPDPRRFATIKKGLKEFANGRHTIASLTDEFNGWGLTTSTGKPVYRQFVDRMLTDKYYAGILNDPWTSQEHIGKHEPMITLDEFYAIQVVKQAWSNGAVGGRRFIHPDFPLRNFVVCVCGKPLTGSRHKGRGGIYAYYNCYNRSCSHCNVYVSSARLEAQFIAMLGGAGLDEKTIEHIRNLVAKRLQTRNAGTRTQAEKVTRDAARLETEKQCLLEMRLKGEVSPTEFATQKKRIESERAAAHDCVARQADVSGEFDVDGAFDEAKKILADPSKFWQELSDVASKREFQKVLLASHPAYNPTKESFGTPKFSRVFRVFEGSDLTNLKNVAGVGHDVNPIIESIKEICGFLKWLRADTHSPRNEREFYWNPHKP